MKSLEGIVQGKSNTLRVVEDGELTPCFLILYYYRCGILGLTLGRK